MAQEQQFAESFLYHIWDHLHLRQDELLTIDGRAVKILFQGRWNCGRGPDFQNAVLEFDGQPVKGDVEIHFFSRDWHQHGHDKDSVYNRVILHVVYYPTGEKAVFNSIAEPIPQLIMQPVLAMSIEKLWNRYGERAFSREEEAVCCSLVELDNTDKQKWIECAGKERLHGKLKRLASELVLASFDEVCYGGILEALGYSKNKIAFQQLQELLPLETVQAVLHDNSHKDDHSLLLQSLLLGVSGLLPTKAEQLAKMPRENRELVESYRNQWNHLQRKYTLSQMFPGEWEYHQIRPQNFPTIRLAALAHFLARSYRMGIFQSMVSLFAQQQTKRQRLQQIKALFSLASDPYWRYHYSLLDRPSAPHEGLGETRIRTMIFNLFLPLLLIYTRQMHWNDVHQKLWESYEGFPKLTTNHKQKIVAHQMQWKPKNELQQQGMLYIYDRYCAWHCCGLCKESALHSLK